MSQRLEKTQFEARLARDGIASVFERNQVRYRIACSSCEAEESVRLGSKSSDHDQIRQRFEKAGWETGRAPVCPRCRLAALNPKPTPTEEPPMTTAQVTPMPKEIAPTMREIAAISLKLDALFDKDKGVFLNGYSDDRIAKELDVAPAKVIRVREDAFGPLKHDPEIIALKGDIEALQELVFAAERASQNAIANLRGQLEDMQRRLRKLEDRRNAA